MTVRPLYSTFKADFFTMIYYKCKGTATRQKMTRFKPHLLKKSCLENPNGNACSVLDLEHVLQT